MNTEENHKNTDNNTNQPYASGYKIAQKRNIDFGQLFLSILLIAFIIGFIYYTFYITDNIALRIIAWMSISIVAVSFFGKYVINYLTGSGYLILSAINDFMFIFVAIPIIVISATYLPITIMITFLKIQSTSFYYAFILIFMVILQILAISFIVTKFLQERNMNAIQYVKYLFNFKLRAEEKKKFRQRSNIIDHYYNNLNRIEDNVAKKREERDSQEGTFEDFDWKARLKEIGANPIRNVQCKSCKKLNFDNSLECDGCGAALGEKLCNNCGLMNLRKSKKCVSCGAEL